MSIKEFQQEYCKICKNKFTDLCEIVRKIDGKHGCRNFERENIESDCVFLKKDKCKALTKKDCEDCKFYMNRKQYISKMKKIEKETRDKGMKVVMDDNKIKLAPIESNYSTPVNLGMIYKQIIDKENLE